MIYIEKERLKQIHPNSKVNNNSFIDIFTIIGKGSIISEDVYVSQGAKIYGNVEIGAGTYIGENCIIGYPRKEELKALKASKVSVFEFQGNKVKIGKNCTIRANTIIYSDVIIGNNCQTGHNVLIREKTQIGDSTLIGTNSCIDGNVKIGKQVSIQTGVYIPLFSEIGNDAFLGPFSKLTNDKYMMRKKYELKGPVIEDEVSLGANSVILPGIRIKKGTMVGAGAVVNKGTEERDIIAGNPAKFIKKVPPDWNT